MDDFNDGLVLPTLIRQLRSILDQYPDDGQILKEVIQNAEDAGATRVVFLVDHTTYGTDASQLYEPRLAQFQGPALYVCNNATFSDNDWKGIRLLQESIKENDPMKVGRFGLGFKSVFHMTDFPSVFSDRGIAFIDPHMKYFKKLDRNGHQTTEATSSFLFHLVKNKDDIARLRHQFEPFIHDLFGISEDTLKQGQFNGTVFRFPLRNNSQVSDLTSTLYDAPKVKSLINSLHTDAHHMLLFLKNIESIQVYEKKSQTDRNPKQLLQIRIVPEFLNTLKVQRQDFQNKVREKTSCWMKNDAITSVYPIAVEVIGTDGNTPPSSVSHWIVSQYHAGKEDATKCKVEKELGYLPIVGTAIEVDTNNEDLCMTEPKGHVFCFLPLPLEKKSPTGLRFHVHGCFAIDQNRRHMKWPTADQTGQLKDPALLWNCFLVNTVMPKAMTELATFIVNLQQMDGRVMQLVPSAMKQMLKDKIREDKEFMARLVYAILPDSTKVTAQWKTSSKEFADELLKGRAYFFSPAISSWLQWEGTIFDPLDSNDRRALLLRSVLHEDHQKLVCVPSYVFSLLPDRVARITAEHVAASLKRVQDVMKLSDNDRRTLLDYLIGELRGLNDLVDLHLLPLANGSWTTFKTRSRTTERIYFESKDHPRSLLPGLGEKFVEVKCLRKKCVEIARELLAYANSCCFCLFH